MIENPKSTPLDDLEELRLRLELLCRAIAPSDIGTLPFYVVFASDLPTEMTGTMTGFTSPFQDELCRPYIKSWRGRGPCFVVDDGMATQSVRRMLPNCDHAACWQFACGTMTATAMHEFAHILASGVWLIELSDADGLREALTRRVAAEKRQTAAGAPPAVDFDDHGLAFIRSCCHIHWRAEQLGIRFPLPTICGGVQYKLSCASRYAFALHGEPKRLAGWTFKEIIATEPPSMLAGLYESDVRRRTRLSAR